MVNTITSQETDSNTVDQRVTQSAAVLAVLGWQRGELEDTITDTFKVRRVGLWNFVSVQEELDRVEDLRVARELSGDSQGEDPSPKKKELEGKKYLDPVKEHLPWHPLVVREEGGRAGWEMVRDSRSSSSPSLDTEHRSGGPGLAETVLSRVRALMELW